MNYVAWVEYKKVRWTWIISFPRVMFISRIDVPNV